MISESLGTFNSHKSSNWKVFQLHKLIIALQTESLSWEDSSENSWLQQSQNDVGSFFEIIHT